MESIRITEWYEIGYLLVQGFEADFVPRQGYPEQLDAVFTWSAELDRARLDYLSNKGVPVLSLKDAVKLVAAKNAAQRRAVLA